MCKNISYLGDLGDFNPFFFLPAFEVSDCIIMVIQRYEMKQCFLGDFLFCNKVDNDV